MSKIFQFLAEHGIAYERYDHPAVFTCEEGVKYVPRGVGADTKNLFLKNRNSTKYYLVTVKCEKRVDLKALCALLSESKLSFASPERLMEYLGLTPGAVTLLGLINDPEHRVRVYLDQCVYDSDYVLCHPLVNTSTLRISQSGIRTFLSATSPDYRVIDIPSR